MEVEEELKWKTTKEELPPNEMLDRMEILLKSLKDLKSEFVKEADNLKVIKEEEDNK